MEDREFDGTSAAKAGPGLVFWIGLVVVIGATGYILTSSMASTVHYYEVNEAKNNAELIGELIRLRGTVVDGSHRIKEGTVDEHIFVLTAGQAQTTVTFKGAVPDQFRDGASVIASGVLLDSETFQADSMTAQCPSRYENEAPTAGGSEACDDGPTTTDGGAVCGEGPDS